MDDIVANAQQYNIIGANVYELLDQPEYQSRAGKASEAEYGVYTTTGGDTDTSRAIQKWMDS